LRGLDYEDQAEQIRELMTRYNVTHIGIDTSGIGDSDYQLLLKFFPQVMAYKYSVEVRINKGRLEYGNGAKEITANFMSIRKTITASGRQITYGVSVIYQRWLICR